MEKTLEGKIRERVKKSVLNKTHEARTYFFKAGVNPFEVLKETNNGRMGDRSYSFEIKIPETNCFFYAVKHGVHGMFGFVNSKGICRGFKEIIAS